MKKAIASILIILISLSLFTCNVLASPKASEIDYGESETLDEAGKGIKEEDINGYFKDGTSTSTSEDENGQPQTQTDSLSESASAWDTIMSILSKVLAILPKVLSWLMSCAVNNTILPKAEDTFTIQSLLSNQYTLFNIDIFNTEETGSNSELINSLHKNVAIWYISLRNIAIAGSVIILIYIGIRMSIAIIAEDKAKYKNMLMGWLVGLILLLSLQYIILLIISASNLLISLLDDSIGTQGIENIELNIVTDVYKNIDNQATGALKVYYLILYAAFIAYETKFFILYFNRMIRVCFYVIISPLVCMTYSIDRIKDNKSQAFDAWVKEFGYEIFMQPIELIIYLLFLYSASEIIRTAPIVAIIFFIALNRGEKTVKKALNIKPSFNKGLDEFHFRNMAKGFSHKK